MTRRRVRFGERALGLLVWVNALHTSGEDVVSVDAEAEFFGKFEKLYFFACLAAW